MAKFIEVTAANGKKAFVNSDHIILLIDREDDRTGIFTSTNESNLIADESYVTVKALLKDH
jgi:hypothetical protein